MKKVILHLDFDSEREFRFFLKNLEQLYEDVLIKVEVINDEKIME